MNVSPKDIAILVAPNEWAGATCEVLASGNERVPPFLVAKHGHYWFVRFPRPMPWSDPNPLVNPCEGCVPDAHLRRIAGPGIEVNWWTGQGVGVPQKDRLASTVSRVAS